MCVLKSWEVLVPDLFLCDVKEERKRTDQGLDLSRFISTLASLAESRWS